MNSSFKIETTDYVTVRAKLYLEIGLYHIAYFVIDNDNECIAIHFYRYAGDGTVDKMAGFLKQLASEQNILQENFSKVVVFYAFPTALLTPSDYAGEENRKKMLEFVHGDINDVFIRSDFIYGHGIQNIYTVPKQMDAVIDYLFAAPVSTHQYSLLPDMTKTEGNLLYCIFDGGQFAVMLKKDQKIQAIQTFSFDKPEDVAFFLLQLCEGFGVDPSTVSVELSGMIDSDSSLFTELKKYFLSLTFTSLPGEFTYPASISDFPEHYFSHLFAAALCV